MEGEEQSTTLTEIEDVLSLRSFELLVEWLHLGRIHYDVKKGEESITAAMEFVRLTDMFGITGMESLVTEHIKDTIKANPGPYKTESGLKEPGTNTYSLISKHIISASFLPDAHPVRQLLAEATVEGYLQQANYKFLKEAHDVPHFSKDLLKAIKLTLATLKSKDSAIIVTDPITDVAIKLKELKMNELCESRPSDIRQRLRLFD